MIKKVFYLSFFVTFFLLIKNSQKYILIFSPRKTKSQLPRSQQTDRVKSSEKIPRLSVNGRSAPANRFCPIKLVLRRLRGSRDVIRMECENPAFWLVHLYHVTSILDSDWSVRIPAHYYYFDGGKA